MKEILQNFSLPITDPVLIFSLVLLIILLSPLILNKLKIPHIVGLIFAGVIFGPYGLGILDHDSSFRLFGQVGMLYIMFIAGIDMDMNDFLQNRNKSIVFGLLTFFIPMILGIATGGYLMYYIYTRMAGGEPITWISGATGNAEMLKYATYSAIILASMYASNTLIAYPIVSRLGVSRSRSVTITVGGTMVGVILSLLVLAIMLEVAKGELDYIFWIRFIVSIAIYGLIVIYLFPLFARWFFKHYADSILQYIFVLALVFLSSFLAKIAGVEYIIGAFLAGISLNRLIPKRSPLMNRINFVGNALFIPFFLISVGMIINVRIMFGSHVTILVAVVMSVVATLAKYLAAQATRLIYKMDRTEGTMIFGLSNAQAASSLAAVMLAYEAVIGTTASGEPVRLLTEEILNGTVIMILVTCVISSVLTESAAKRLAAVPNVSQTKGSDYRPEMRIMLSVSNPATMEKLMELAVLLNDRKYKQPIYALKVVDFDSVDEKLSEETDKLLERAAYLGSASDNKVKKIKRYDVNVASGITNVIREKNISDVVMGINPKARLADAVFGSMMDTILERVNRIVYVLSSVQPLSTIHRIVLVVPPNAEKESGFRKWCSSVLTIAVQTGAVIEAFAPKECLVEFVRNLRRENRNVRPKMRYQSEFSLDKPLGELTDNDLLIVISARKHSLSYVDGFDSLLTTLSKRVKNSNFNVLYPEQFKEGEIDRIQEINAKII